MADSLTGPAHSQHHLHHHHVRRRHVSSCDEQEEEELDPRIQVELEKLNKASEEINRLELELDDARAAFRQVLSDSTQRLNGLAKKLGTCVDKARPYYDARMKLKEAHIDSQKAALRFERACSMHEAAKEMVQLAEEGYKRREQDLDPTWQEMLNHATMKVNDAERERMESEENHQQTTLNFKKKEEEVQKLQKDLKRTITKSRPYFEMKAKFNQVMEDHKRTVSRLEDDVTASKCLYSQALRNLEAISDDIHRQRLERRQKLQLGVRGAGVGAESPSPPPSWDKGSNIDGSASGHMFPGDVDEDVLNANCRETILDVNQLRATRSDMKGIVGHDLAYRKRTSISESFIQEGKFKTDPLNVVVFKTSTSDMRSGSSPPRPVQHEFSPPSVIRSSPDRARNSSYRAAIEASGREQNPREENWSQEESEEQVCDAAVTPTPGREQRAVAGENPPGLPIVGLHGPELNSADLASGRDSGSSLLSGSPRGSRGHEIEMAQSSLSRAQEWVNRSPVPQQKRFIKSQSLIDASSPPLSADGYLSLSMTGEAMKAAISRGEKLSSPSGPVVRHQPLDSGGRTTPVSVQDKKLHIHLNVEDDTPSSSPNLTTSQASLRSHGSTPERGSPLSGSPSLHRKSPKLQGLILRVDASRMDPMSSSPTAKKTPTNMTPNEGPPVVISTQHPTLGVFTEQHQPSSSLSSPNTAPSSVSPTAASSDVAKTQPTSLLSQHISGMSKTSKVSSYSSKTAPSTLGTPFQKLSPNPPSSSQASAQLQMRAPLTLVPLATSLKHQLVSPTPLSPSGKSDSLSGASSSHRAALLKVPSDSSDTESIASTGPMLDDDQVELLALDFNEQTLDAQRNENCEYDEDEEAIRASIQRNSWARMSLPPRLSYLEGYLERTLHISGRQRDISEGSQTSPEEGEAASSITGSEHMEGSNAVGNISTAVDEVNGNVAVEEINTAVDEVSANVAVEATSAVVDETSTAIDETSTAIDEPSGGDAVCENRVAVEESTEGVLDIAASVENLECECDEKQESEASIQLEKEGDVSVNIEITLAGDREENISPQTQSHTLEVMGSSCEESEDLSTNSDFVMVSDKDGDSGKDISTEATLVISDEGEVHVDDSAAEESGELFV